MVQYYEQVNTFDAPLQYLALAHSMRFPSPYSPHILSSDVISRSFPTPTKIRTTRLLLKKGTMPRWAPGAIAKIGTSWVLEESELDMEREEGKNLRTRSRNIQHTNFMEVSEWQTFTEWEEDIEMTKAVTLSRVVSDFSFWPVRNRIEKFGVNRVPKAGEKARAGLALIVSLLVDPASCSTVLQAGPLTPYPFGPLPTSLAYASEIMRAKFAEARQSVRRREVDSPGRSGEEGQDEPGRIWRMRWRLAVKRGVGRFRERICGVTGFLCDDKCLE